jgi:hypothetical protein
MQVSLNCQRENYYDVETQFEIWIYIDRLILSKSSEVTGQTRKRDRRQPRRLHFVARGFVGRFGLRKKCTSRPKDFLLERPVWITKIGDGTDFHWA